MTTNEKLSAQVIGELEQENERLRAIICAFWRNANDPSYYMDKYTVANTIAIVAEEKNKEVTK